MNSVWVFRETFNIGFFLIRAENIKNVQYFFESKQMECDDSVYTRKDWNTPTSVLFKYVTGPSFY